MNFTLKGNTTVIASLRHSGKSELARMLILKEKNNFDSIFVISPTNKCNCFYDFIDQRNIIDKYSDEWVNQLFSKMEKLNLGKNEKSSDAVHVLFIIRNPKFLTASLYISWNLSFCIFAKVY